jgi:hypothetical protein
MRPIAACTAASSPPGGAEQPAVAGFGDGADEGVLVHPRAGLDVGQRAVGWQLDHGGHWRRVVVDHQCQALHRLCRVWRQRAAQRHRHEGRIVRPAGRGECDLPGGGRAVDRPVAELCRTDGLPARARVRIVPGRQLRPRRSGQAQQPGLERPARQLQSVGRGVHGITKQAFFTRVCSAR